MCVDYLPTQHKVHMCVETQWQTKHEGGASPGGRRGVRGRTRRLGMPFSSRGPSVHFGQALLLFVVPPSQCPAAADVLGHTSPTCPWRGLGPTLLSAPRVLLCLGFTSCPGPTSSSWLGRCGQVWNLVAQKSDFYWEGTEANDPGVPTRVTALPPVCWAQAVLFGKSAVEAPLRN